MSVGGETLRVCHAGGEEPQGRAKCWAQNHRFNSWTSKMCSAEAVRLASENSCPELSQAFAGMRKY